MVEYVKDNIQGGYRPSLYPGEGNTEEWGVPPEHSRDFERLNSIIENKYTREYLKICAFYNKLFPSLKESSWETSSYNTIPFTTMDQERSDTGTGINFNYLKQIVDHITSRIGTISFVPTLMSEDQSIEYLVYKDEAERVIRMLMKKDKLNKKTLEAFHNAAVVGYSHIFMDPYTHHMRKANDFEVGIYESQLNKDSVKQMLYRDYAFPKADLGPYIEGIGDELLEKVTESVESKHTIDLKMYINAVDHKVYCVVNNITLPKKEYPFDHVLIDTFVWDTGFSKVTTASLFDLLYPQQREINKIAAKIQQLIRMYKGPVPVFDSQVDLAMKEITNGSGEALYVNSNRPIDSLVTVINPTPLDPQLSAEIQNYKTAMYELSGMSQSSFNMDNMRSAAAVVALDQTRDTVFQAQLAGMADFIKVILNMYVEYYAKFPEHAASERKGVDWDVMYRLINSSYIDLKPMHINDFMSDENEAKQETPDYAQQAGMRTVLEIIKGEVTFETMPYFLDKNMITFEVAALLVKFEALGVEIPATIDQYLMSAYLNEVAEGRLQL